MIRLFVALKIPEEVKAKVNEIRRNISPEHEGLRWESNDKLHLTLKFIGEVEDSLVKPISGALSFIEEYDKFFCSLTQFGFFFKRQEAKILWLGLNTDKRIYNLVDKVNSELEQFSITREERKFKAHLTLLRIKRKVDDDFIKKFRSFKIPEIKFIAGEIALIKSELLPGGSKYSDIKTYKLK